MPTIVDYDPAWPERYREEAARIRDALAFRDYLGASGDGRQVRGS